MLLRRPNESDNHVLREEVERIKLLYQQEVDELTAELELKESEVSTLLLYERLKDRLKSHCPTDELLLNQICNGIAHKADLPKQEQIAPPSFHHPFYESGLRIRESIKSLRENTQQTDIRYILEEVVQPLHDMLVGVRKLSKKINILERKTSIEIAKSGESRQRITAISDEISYLSRQAYHISFEIENFIQDILEASDL